MTEDETFDGVPLEDLVFDDVDWTLQKEHVEQRAERKGTTEYAPKVEWATEACQDPQRAVYRTAMAVVVVGHSPSAGRLLRSVVRPLGHASKGQWVGVTAHAASARDKTLYQEAT